jgi:hypothetical protein
MAAGRAHRRVLDARAHAARLTTLSADCLIETVWPTADTPVYYCSVHASAISWDEATALACDTFRSAVRIEAIK